VLSHSGVPYSVEDFTPYGYDERQYNSPGFKLPVGALMRTPNGRYEQYHTNDDNLDFITPEALAGSYEILCTIIDVLEHDGRFLNLYPRGEPQLGRWNLYNGSQDEIMALLWVLNFSDGQFSLLDIAERGKMPFPEIKRAAERLTAAGLLRLVADSGRRQTTQSPPVLNSYSFSLPMRGARGQRIGDLGMEDTDGCLPKKGPDRKNYLP